MRRESSNREGNAPPAPASEPSAAAVVARLAPKWTAPIPAAASARATLVLADYVGAAIAGSGEAEQVAMRRRLLTGRDSAGRCTVIGQREGADAATAAFLNASAGTAAELDDRLPEARTHPGTHVIPLAMSLAEAADLAGADLIGAIVLGYEAAGILGDYFHERPDWLHPHAYWCAAAAAVAGASIKGLEPGHLADLINCTLLVSPRLPFAAAWEGATVRNFYAGFGVAAAMRSLECVEAGITAPAQALQFVRTRVGMRAAREGAGRHSGYAVERATFKFLPVCFSLHAAVHAVRKLKAQLGPARVDRVTVTGPEHLAHFMREAPANALARRFNLRFALAEEIIHGLGPDPTLHPEDPEVTALAAKVSLVPSADASTVTICTAAGTSASAAVPPEVPYPAEEDLPQQVKAKFFAAVAPRMQHRRTAELWDYLAAIRDVERVDLRSLM